MSLLFVRTEGHAWGLPEKTKRKCLHAIGVSSRIHIVLTCFVSNIYSHPGCSCPDGYAGSHCELRNDAFAAIGKSSKAGSESAMLNVHKETRTFLGVFFVVSLVVSGATYYAYRKRKESQDKDFVRRAEMDGPPIQGHTSAPVLDIGPDMRFDGRYFDGIIDLKDVEII